MDEARPGRIDTKERSVEVLRSASMVWTLAAVLAVGTWQSFAGEAAGASGVSQRPSSSERLIEIYRGRCYGACPEYAVTLWTTGKLDYQGYECVKVHGFRSKRFTKADMKRVTAALGQTDVFGRSRGKGARRPIDAPWDSLEVWFKGKHAAFTTDIDKSFKPLLRSIEQDADLQSWIGSSDRSDCEDVEQTIHGL